MESEVKWDRWLVAFLVTLIILFGWLFRFQVAVDPFGVWGTEAEAGFNNYKVVQNRTERLWKIYEYALRKPDVVYFGTSRTNFCMPAEWPQIPRDKVYNFGVRAVHIPEEKYFFEYSLRAHKPRLALLGFDFLQFSSTANEPRDGFSEERLDFVSRSSVSAFLYKLRDSVLSFDAIAGSFDVLSASAQSPNETYSQSGWDTQELKKKYPTKRWKYRRELYRFHTRTYRRFRSSEENYAQLAEMVRFARDRSVEVMLYINPVHADFLVSCYTNRKWKEFERFKRELVAQGPVWDFNYVNDITVDRTYFQDPSHFKVEVSRWLIDVMAGGEPIKGFDFGVLLTSENVESELKRQRGLLNRYMRENRGIVDMLVAARKTKDQKAFNREARRLIGR